MTKEQLLEKACELLKEGWVYDIRDAIADAAESFLTQEDAEAWYNGETTQNLYLLISTLKEFDATPIVWGSPEGPEPLTVEAEY